ncbi:MAG: hypothetical protein KDD40_09710, partial [Bdellovibrionales bacterium]|nr:hypothetical protein [Bdellovibrionales bacterium]
MHNFLQVIVTVLISFQFLIFSHAESETSSNECEKAITNPFTQLIDLPYEQAEAFDVELDVSEAPKAIAQVGQELREAFDEVVTQPEAATYENTLKPVLLAMSRMLNLVKLVYLKSGKYTGVFFTNKEPTADFKQKSEAWKQVKAYVKAEIRDANTYGLLMPEFQQRLAELGAQSQLNDFEKSMVQVIGKEIKYETAKLQINPLLHDSGLDYGAFAFDKYKMEHFYPAILVAARRAEQAFVALRDSTEKPSYENTVKALSYIDSDFDRISNVLDIYTSNYNIDKHKDELNRLVRFESDLSIDLSNKI